MLSLKKQNKIKQNTCPSIILLYPSENKIFLKTLGKTRCLFRGRVVAKVSKCCATTVYMQSKSLTHVLLNHRLCDHKLIKYAMGTLALFQCSILLPHLPLILAPALLLSYSKQICPASEPLLSYPISGSTLILCTKNHNVGFFDFIFWALNKYITCISCHFGNKTL